MLDIFYNADVVVVDMSIPVQQAPLYYHIGIRQSMSMKNNIAICFDTDPELTVSLRVSRSEIQQKLRYSLYLKSNVTAAVS